MEQPATFYISAGVQAELKACGVSTNLKVLIRPRDSPFSTSMLLHPPDVIEDSSGWTLGIRGEIETERGSIDRILKRTWVLTTGDRRERRGYVQVECRMERGGEEWSEPFTGWRARDKGCVRLWDFPLSVFVGYTH